MAYTGPANSNWHGGDSDYAYWRWVLLQSGCTSDLIGEIEVAVLRVQFEKAPG